MWFAQSGHAVSKQDVLFYAPLDGSLKAQVAGGAADPVQGTSQASFVQGRSGQGLLAGGSGSAVRYATEGNLELESGSVCLWVKPVDWGMDSYLRHFFEMRQAPSASSPGTESFLWLYRFFNYSVFWLAQQDTYRREFHRLTPASGDEGGFVSYQWEPQAWGHWLACWSGNQMSLYIDGEHVGQMYLPGDLFSVTADDRHLPKRLVALFNWSNQPRTVSVHAQALGLDPSQPCWDADFFNRQDIQKRQGSWQVTLPPHHVRLSHLTPVRQNPGILDSELRIDRIHQNGRTLSLKMHGALTSRLTAHWPGVRSLKAIRSTCDVQVAGLEPELFEVTLAGDQTYRSIGLEIQSQDAGG